MAGPGASVWSVLNPLGGRCLVVIDPGTRFLKLLAVRARFGRVRVLQQHTVDLQGEGVLEGGEISEHLASLFPDLHGLERAVLVPQDRAICLTVDVPVEDPIEVQDYLLREARRLSGMDAQELRCVHAPLRPFGRYRNPYWLTFCRRSEIDELTRQFLVGEEIDGEWETGGLGEIATTAQALFAASRRLRGRPANAVLIELRSRMTVVGLLIQGQGCFATTLPDGFAAMAEAAARDDGVPPEQAAEALRNGPGFEAPGPALQEVIDRWYERLQTAVSEWLEDHPELNLTLRQLPAYVCGSGAQGGGIVRAVGALAPLKLRPWDARMPGGRGEVASFWAAYGLALHALRRGPHRLSLLTEELNQAARRRRRWRVWQRFNVLLLLLLALTLGAAIFHHQRELEQKQTLLARLQTVLDASREMVRLHERLHRDYAALHPVLERQLFTLDTLRALTALTTEPSNRTHWAVLFADAPSYAIGSTLPVSLLGTNALPADPAARPREFIVEYCIPGDGNILLTNLSRIVHRLREQPVFEQVDTLPPERRRNLAPPAVIISNRLYALSLRMAGPSLPGPEVFSQTVVASLPAPTETTARPAATNRVPVPLRITRRPGEPPPTPQPEAAP